MRILEKLTYIKSKKDAEIANIDTESILIIVP